MRYPFPMSMRGTLWAAVLFVASQGCEANEGATDAGVERDGARTMQEERDAGRRDAAASDAGRDAQARDVDAQSAWVEPPLRVMLCPAGQVVCNGACLAAPGQSENGCTLIALGNVTSIAIDGSEVFFAYGRRTDPASGATESQIARYREEDGSIETLHKDVPAVGLALDADALYFSRPVVSGPDGDGGVAVTTPGSLWRVPRAGGPAEKQLDDLQETVDYLVVTANRLFFGNGTFNLASIPIGGGAITTLHSGSDATLWATSLIDGERLFVEETTSIRVAPLSDLTTFRDVGPRGRFSFVADRDALYVPQGSLTSQVWIQRMPKTPGATLRLANLYAPGERNFPVSVRAARGGYAYVFRAKPEEPFTVQRTSRENELQNIAVLRTLLTIAGLRNPPLALTDTALYIGTTDALLRVTLP